MSKNGQPAIQTMAEIEEQYPDEWVVVEVTHGHKDRARLRGRLIAHDSDRDRLHRHHLAFVAAHPNAHTYVSFTGDVVAPGVVAVL